MPRECRQCGAVIPPQRGPGKPRVKCEKCSPFKPRPKRRKTVAVVPPLDVEAGGSLVDAVQTTLERHGRLDTSDGAAALYAARLLDAGGQTGAAVASLLRELRAAMADATRGTTPVEDVVDELRARRRARRGT